MHARQTSRVPVHDLVEVLVGGEEGDGPPGDNRDHIAQELPQALHDVHSVAPAKPKVEIGAGGRLCQGEGQQPVAADDVAAAEAVDFSVRHVREKGEHRSQRAQRARCQDDAPSLGQHLLDVVVWKGKVSKKGFKKHNQSADTCTGETHRTAMPLPPHAQPCLCKVLSRVEEAIFRALSLHNDSSILVGVTQPAQQREQGIQRGHAGVGWCRCCSCSKFIALLALARSQGFGQTRDLEHQFCVGARPGSRGCEGKACVLYAKDCSSMAAAQAKESSPSPSKSQERTLRSQCLTAGDDTR